MTSVEPLHTECLPRYKITKLVSKRDVGVFRADNHRECELFKSAGIVQDVGSYLKAPKFKGILRVSRIQPLGRVEFEPHYAVKLVCSDGNLENLARC